MGVMTGPRPRDGGECVMNSSDYTVFQTPQSVPSIMTAIQGDPLKSTHNQFVGATRPRSRSVWALCGIAIAIAAILISRPEWRTAPNDFAFYWTAVKVVRAAGNPYSPQETVALEKQLDFAGKGPLVMLNPPWILPLIVPFGLLSFSVAKSCWMDISVILLAVSVQWLWELYGGGLDFWIAWVLTATFLPVFVVLIISQVGLFLLFG